MSMPPSTNRDSAAFNRRQLLAGTTAALASGAAAQAAAVDPERKLRGNIQHSIVWWCFRKYWDVETMATKAAQWGCRSIELIPPEHWPTLHNHGLTVAIASSHAFREGFNNRDQWDSCSKRLRAVIDQCAEAGVKRVITFTGFANGLTRKKGAENCVEGLKPIVEYASEKEITLCLEMLNTRDSSHPMKGHPGYQGDHTEYCIDIIRRVDSEYLKLLFDVYHVQIMDGDVIRRIHEFKKEIGHVHTAGNPGRGELDQRQEINYPAIMQALVEVEYDGFVGHEFIPSRAPEKGLLEAIQWCDV